MCFLFSCRTCFWVCFVFVFVLLVQVGYKSVDDYVTSGMVVGLGTGSTAAFAGKCTFIPAFIHAFIHLYGYSLSQSFSRSFFQPFI